MRRCRGVVERPIMARSHRESHHNDAITDQNSLQQTSATKSALSRPSRASVAPSARQAQARQPWSIRLASKHPTELWFAGSDYSPNIASKKGASLRWMASPFPTKHGAGVRSWPDLGQCVLSARVPPPNMAATAKRTNGRCRVLVPL
jgi:hypothetical protein